MIRMPLIKSYVDYREKRMYEVCKSFKKLVSSLERSSRYLALLRHCNSQRDQDSGNSRSYDTQLDEIISVDQSHGLLGGDHDPVTLNANRFFNRGMWRYVKYSHAYGKRVGQLDVQPYVTSEDPAPDYLAEYTRIIQTVLDWQPHRFIKINFNYEALWECSVFYPRKPNIGWACWTPGSYMPEDIPSAHLVRPLGPGTFIAAEPEPFTHEDAAKVARMQQVEIELNAVGGLPPRETFMYVVPQ